MKSFAMQKDEIIINYDEIGHCPMKSNPPSALRISSLAISSELCKDFIHR